MQPQSYQAPPSPMQPAPVKKKRSISTILTWVLVTVVSLAVLCGIAWAVIYFMGYTSSDTGKTQANAAAALEPVDSVSIMRTIDSQLGITVAYDARELEAYGFADEVTYSSADLSESRPYTVIRVRPVSTSEATRSNVTLASPELRMTSSLNKNYWEVLAKKEGYEELSKLDMLVKETVDVRETDAMVESSDVEVREVGEVSYRKIVFTSTDERYGVTTERREDCYVAVENDRPYVACINNIRPSNFAAASQLEVVLAQTAYTQINDEVLDAGGDAKDDESLVDDTSDEVVESSVDEQGESDEKAVAAVVPPHLKDSADFRSLAAAAPATVRVGTVYCADIRLTLPNGSDGPTLTGACVDRAGTGFFISRDGLIATSASVTRVKPQDAIAAYITNAPNATQVTQRLERVLNYLVESRVLMQTDADALIAGVEERDQDIIAKVNEISARIEPENISITKEDYKYAIQLGDKPIVVTHQGDGSSSFTYTDSVVDATFEAATYSSTQTQDDIYKGESESGDVALLTVEKQAAYPVISLGRSGEGLAEKTAVNIVGRPMYAFGSLESAQFRATPMYRSAQVSETFSATEGQRLRAVSTPSHAGFAGAPVVDRTHSAVGMATYNNLNCPDQECFASTIIRDTTGLSELVRKRNITLATVSPSSEVWVRGISELTRGNYKGATGLFKEAAQLYPQNYLAQQFIEYSEAQYGTASDTSTMNLIVRILQTAIVLLGILLVLLAIAKIALKIFMKPHTETQYAHMNTGAYIDPSQWQQQSPQTLAPQSTAMPQPAAWQPSQPQPYTPTSPQSQPYTGQPQPQQPSPPQQYGETQPPQQ